MTVRDCPICGGNAAGLTFPYATQWNGKLFSYFACASCKATFVDPAPNDADFALMYSKANYHDEHYSRVAAENYRASIQLLKKQAPQVHSLLDFGCGNGAFITAGHQEGLECAGVEMDAATIDFAKVNSGCPVDTLEATRASGRTFDCIHLGDVLEHLPQPSVLLHELEGLLAPCGLFFIEGPLENNPSPVAAMAQFFGNAKRRLGDKKPGTHKPTHLFRVDATNQRAFFTNVMGYGERYFAVYETGWPYYEQGASWRWSPGFVIKQSIGHVARALGGKAVPGGGTFGNRFAGLYALGVQINPKGPA